MKSSIFARSILCACGLAAGLTAAANAQAVLTPQMAQALAAASSANGNTSAVLLQSGAAALLAKSALSAQGGQTASSVVAVDPAAPMQAPEPKKEGVIRVGVLQPAVTLQSSSQTLAETVRIFEMQQVTGGKIEAIRLSGQNAAGAAMEEKMLGCDYLLASSVSQKSAAGRFGGLKAFSSMAGTASSFIPAVALTQGVAGAMATGAAMSAVSSAFSGVKANSEISYEYTLTNLATGAVTLKDERKAKPQTDGQDVVSPMVSDTAAKIVAALGGR